AQEKADPFDALYGEWAIDEMVFEGVDQEASKFGWWIRFTKDSFEISYGAKCPCVIRPGEIDIDISKLAGGGGPILARYDLKGEKLRLVWGGDVGDGRPTSFDALNNPRLTLYVLKKKNA